MRNGTRRYVAVSGAAMLALALAGTISARADDSPTASSQQTQQQWYEQMQARMQGMHALMTQIHQATDPAVRQQLMTRQMQMMQAQMHDMGMMNGQMMGNGTMGCGTTGGGMMGGSMMGGGAMRMQPGTRSPTD
jgi:ABC-type transport system involved in cytochrome bd biosynthesis fused ATPase/permease subunit